MPLFSHCHQLSIVEDKEIARQLYLYGGDLGNNDSTVGVVSLVA